MYKESTLDVISCFDQLIDLPAEFCTLTLSAKTYRYRHNTWICMDILAYNIKLYASLIAVISFQKLLRLSVWIFHPKNHHVSLNIHTQVAFNMNNFIFLLTPTRAGQHIRPSTETLMLFCRVLSYVLVIFLNCHYIYR